MTRAASAPRRLACLGALVGLMALSACGASRQDAALRFDAERARWKVERLERRLREAAMDSLAASRRLQHEHAEIARRFGPQRSLGAEAVLGDDARVRYYIAGSSALYAADVAARDSASEQICAQYALLAERYAFDPEIALSARVRQGLTRERRGQPAAALAAYSRALESPPPGTPTSREVPPHEQLRADLEVHATLLAQEILPAGKASERVSQSIERLRRRAVIWAGHRGELRLRRRLGETLAIAGRGDEAITLLQDLLAAATTGESRSEVALTLGEVEEVKRGRLPDAEGWYRRAVDEGLARSIGNDARLHLGHLLLARDRAREAANVYADALTSGASMTAAHRAEALYGEALCMDDLDRKVDALLAANRGAAEEGPFGLASAARRARYSRELGAPDADDEDEAFVERACRSAGAHESTPSLVDFALSMRQRREDEARGDVVAQLNEIALSRVRTAVADSARSAARRLAGDAGEGP